MATTIEYCKYVLECLQKAGNVTARKMMGEYCVYFNEKLIGNICDNCLFLKPTESVLAMMPEAERAYPYEGSKTKMVVVEDMENADWMADILHAMYAELPERKKRIN